MKKESRRTRETVKFLKWTRKFSGWWTLICTPGDEHMDREMMKLLIQKLADKQLYELIFVLCMVHRNAEFMPDLSQYFMRELLLKSWETDPEGVIRSMITCLT